MSGESTSAAGSDPWYTAPKSKVADVLQAQATHLWTMDEPRLARYERYYRLYGGSRLLAMRPWLVPADTYTSQTNRTVEDALRLNVVKAAVDTITSKVGKLRPRPTFLTNGGDWKLRQRAKKLQRFMDGAYHQSQAYEQGPDMFRDGMLFGTGVLHTFDRAERIATERVPLWELFTDIADAVYGSPRVLYRIKWVSCAKVREIYGKEVAAAKLGDNDNNYHSGYVPMVEAWCLPVEDREVADDELDTWRPDSACTRGRHTLLAGTTVLTDEPWDYDEFPFIFDHWSKPVQGFWGDAAVREVIGIQVEINRLIQSVQLAMRKVGVPWILKMNDVTVTPNKLTNDVAQIINVDGSKLGARALDEAVRVVTFQSIHPQVIGHIWSLYAKAFEILGSNQLAASASAPPGLESGRALEQLAEEHSERFMTVSRHYEYVMGQALARQFIRVAKYLDRSIKASGRSEGFVLHSPGTRETLKLRWDEVEIDQDAYLMQVFPASVLPTTPSARIEEVQRLSDAQWITPDEARRLLAFPDLESEDSLVSADLDLLEWQLDKMLGDGEQQTPMPYQNLGRALVRAQQAAMRAQIDGVPERNIDLVRDFIAFTEAMLKAAAPPPTPAAPGSALVTPVGPEAAAPPTGMPPQ